MCEKKMSSPFSATLVEGTTYEVVGRKRAVDAYARAAYTHSMWSASSVTKTEVRYGYRYRSTTIKKESRSRPDFIFSSMGALCATFSITA